MAMSARSKAVGRSAIPLIFQVFFLLIVHCLLGGKQRDQEIVNELMLLCSFPEELSWNFSPFVLSDFFLSRQTESCCCLYFRFWFA